MEAPRARRRESRGMSIPKPDRWRQTPVRSSSGMGEVWRPLGTRWRGDRDECPHFLDHFLDQPLSTVEASFRHKKFLWEPIVALKHGQNLLLQQAGMAGHALPVALPAAFGKRPG